MFSIQSNGSSEQTRRGICRELGRMALAGAPVTFHERWLHDSGPPPSTPLLPSGSVWNLINNVKVLRQYMDLVSEAAAGHGPHAPALHGGEEACVGGLEWMAPLLAPVPRVEELHPEYQQHIDLWRTSNPGLVCNAEAAYHVLQSYVVPDRNMTRMVVSSLMPQAREYDVSIAEHILGSSPGSFDEFQAQLLGWRSRGVYYPLGLAASFMPCAEQWVGASAMHEADDIQELLDGFNTSGFVTTERLRDICDRLLDRTPALRHGFCGLLDRVCVLMRVKSNAVSDEPLDALLPALCCAPPSVLASDGEDQSLYTRTLLHCFVLKRELETGIPPALLCPSLCGLNRDGWGFPRMDLGVDGERLLICTGRLKWIKKGECPPQRMETGISKGLQSDRFQDILLRMGECTTSPEISHLVLDSRSFAECLAGRVVPGDQALYADRARVLEAMESDDYAHDSAFPLCIQGLKDCLPPVYPRTFPEPLSIMAWRVDCPPRAILYTGSSGSLDLQRNPPHVHPKSLLPEKMPERTISGISMLSDTEDSHASLRACIAQGILTQHDDFASHPFHRVCVKARPEQSQPRVKFDMRSSGDSRPAPENGLPIRFSSRSKSAIRHSAQHQRPRSDEARSEVSVAPEPTETVGDGKDTEYTTTTLAETVSVFTGPRPDRHKEVTLHASSPWECDHIDERYAETQRAENGLRFRDWVTIYRHFDDVHRSRLASHHLLITMLFHTHFPMSRPDGGYAWVSVASTLPAETRVLRHLGGKTRLEALKRSVENRFVNDPKLLPVWSHGDRIDQADMEVYTDNEAEQIAVVYAPNAPDGTRKRLELISFRYHALDS